MNFTSRPMSMRNRGHPQQCRSVSYTVQSVTFYQIDISIATQDINLLQKEFVIAKHNLLSFEIGLITLKDNICFKWIYLFGTKWCFYSVQTYTFVVHNLALYWPCWLGGAKDDFACWLSALTVIMVMVHNTMLSV